MPEVNEYEDWQADCEQYYDPDAESPFESEIQLR